MTREKYISLAAIFLFGVITMWAASQFIFDQVAEAQHLNEQMRASWLVCVYYVIVGAVVAFGTFLTHLVMRE